MCSRGVVSRKYVPYLVRPQCLENEVFCVSNVCHRFFFIFRNSAVKLRHGFWCSSFKTFKEKNRNFSSVSESKMDPEKLFEMQRQMRRNNEDLKDFLGDMDSWESEIKQKDTALKDSKSSDKTVWYNINCTSFSFTTQFSVVNLFFKRMVKS